MAKPSETEHVRPDPPMEPHVRSKRWVETGPEVLDGELDDAVLVARIGMASNAVAAQVSLVRRAMDSKEERTNLYMRDVNTSLVTTVAMVFEATKLAQENMAKLRTWFSSAGGREEVLREVGKLCSGKHPIHSLLSRSRNTLGFHWDSDVVEASVRQYRRNKRLVWVENEQNNEFLHSFALAILTHAMFPEADTPDPELATAQIRSALEMVGAATGLIQEFFAGAVFGYLGSVDSMTGER